MEKKIKKRKKFRAKRKGESPLTIIFLTSKRKKTSVRLAPPDNLFLFLKEKIARVASHPLRIYFYFIEYIEYIKNILLFKSYFLSFKMRKIIKNLFFSF